MNDLARTPDRPLVIAAFLDQHQWGEASAQPFDGDFSPRRYARLTSRSGDTAILMDADADQKTPAFIAIDHLLRDCAIDAPEIYAAAPEQGLVLMQDFGRRNIGGLIDAGAPPRDYFLRAAELLARLHKNFDRTEPRAAPLPLFNADLFVLQAELCLDAYFPLATGRDANDDERQDFQAAWRAVLRTIETQPKSLLLRDFMPDNLMELPGGKIGALDFQDAGIGPVAYDLASLCEQVRRDGGFAQLPAVIDAYHAQSDGSLSRDDLLRAATILSAQRHTRILGIIAQAAIKGGRREKLGLLPRVKTHLQNILREPYLRPVQEWMSRVDGLLS